MKKATASRLLLLMSAVIFASPSIAADDPDRKISSYIDKCQRLGRAAGFDVPLRVGDIGIVSKVTMIQIVDPANALAELHWAADVPYKVLGPNGGKFTKTELVRKAVWLSGVSTNNLADGDSIQIVSALEVTGTRQYETAIGGTKTVYVVEPIDISNHAAKIQQVIAAATSGKDDASPPPSDAHGLRTWTDKTGQFTVEAVFIEFRNSQAILKKKNGSTISVDAGKLSDVDQQWIREELARRRDASDQ